MPDQQDPGPITGTWRPTPRRDEIQVHVRDGRYTGWKSVRVTRPLDALAGSFKVEYPASTTPLPIERGDPVKIWLDDNLLLNGYVDRVQGSLSGTFSISGRDQTADLVDSTATNKPGQWFSHGVDELVEALAGPFGIPVIVDDETVGVPKLIYEFTLQNETAGQAIERACRLTGLLAYTPGNGVLHLGKPGRHSRRAEVELIEGQNILDASLDLDNSKRFQFYTVQSQDSGSDSGWGDSVALIQGTAEDPAVGRFRTLVMDAEGPATFTHATDRAQWEATMRAARAGRMNITVVGFRQTPLGRVWRAGELVVVRCPKLRVKSRLLINAVKFRRDTGGSFTELELIRQDSYTPEPQVSPSSDPFAAFTSGADE